MRGRIGRRGDRAIGPLALDLPHVRPTLRHAQALMAPHSYRRITRAPTPVRRHYHGIINNRISSRPEDISTSQTTASTSREDAAERSRVASECGSATTQATLFLWRIRRRCTRLDIDSRSLVRCQSGRALIADDFRCVSAQRSSL